MDIESQPLQLRWKDWIGGLYSVVVPLPSTLDETSSDVKVKFTLTLDFSPRDDSREVIQWTINTVSAQEHVVVAYPGVHRGAMNSSDQAEYYDLFWHTPIFSPYVEVQLPMRWDEYKLILEPASGESKTESRGRSLDVVTEEVIFPKGIAVVSVIQERLKDIARLLVYGPTYDRFKGEVREELATANLPYHDKVTKKFFDNAMYPEVAAFFSRAYCYPIINTGNKSISDEERQRTLKVIVVMFEQYRILQEPPWVKTDKDDWVDDISENIKAVQTENELLAFEKEWATVVSYSCMLHFHEGPWAGDDWMSHVVTHLMR